MGDAIVFQGIIAIKRATGAMVAGTVVVVAGYGDVGKGAARTRAASPRPPLRVYRFGSRARVAGADAWTGTVDGQRFLGRINLIVDELGSDDRFENDRH